MYDLVAVVVHIGSSINRGHYISIVKSEDIWILFDDDIVDVSKPFTGQLLLDMPTGERSGSVVECLTRDQGAVGSSITSVTALWSFSKTHSS